MRSWKWRCKVANEVELRSQAYLADRCSPSVKSFYQSRINIKAATVCVSRVGEGVVYSHVSISPVKSEVFLNS